MCSGNRRNNSLPAEAERQRQHLHDEPQLQFQKHSYHKASKQRVGLIRRVLLSCKGELLFLSWA